MENCVIVAKKGHLNNRGFKVLDALLPALVPPIRTAPVKKKTRPDSLIRTASLLITPLRQGLFLVKHMHIPLRKGNGHAVLFQGQLALFHHIKVHVPVILGLDPGAADQIDTAVA